MTSVVVRNLSYKSVFDRMWRMSAIEKPTKLSVDILSWHPSPVVHRALNSVTLGQPGEVTTRQLFTTIWWHVDHDYLIGGSSSQAHSLPRWISCLHWINMRTWAAGGDGEARQDNLGWLILMVVVDIQSAEKLTLSLSLSECLLSEFGELFKTLLIISRQEAINSLQWWILLLIIVCWYNPRPLRPPTPPPPPTPQLV